MKTSQLINKIGGTILGLCLLLGLGFAFGTTAQAQYRNDPNAQRRNSDWERAQAQARRDQERRDRDLNRNGDNNRNRRGRNGDGYGNYGGTFQLRQTALNAGYNEGIKAGRNDRRKGDRYEFRDESAFQKATKDYSSRLGDRGLYSRYFREAFQNGYDAGYNGY